MIRNALKLHNKKTDIINSFVNGDILFGNLEPDLYLPEDLESEQKFEKSIIERVKIRRQDQEGQGL